MLLLIDSEILNITQVKSLTIRKTSKIKAPLEKMHFFGCDWIISLTVTLGFSLRHCIKGKYRESVCIVAKTYHQQLPGWRCRWTGRPCWWQCTCKLHCTSSWRPTGWGCGACWNWQVYTQECLAWSIGCLPETLLSSKWSLAVDVLKENRCNEG